MGQKTSEPRPAQDDQEHGWFGSAFTVDCILHADIRLVGPGSVQMTLTPSAAEEGTGTWVLRLRTGADGDGVDKLAQFADCLAEGEDFAWAQGELEGLIYQPRTPNEESGSIARVRFTPGAEPQWLREIVLPLQLVEDMGRNLRRLAGAAQGQPADQWEPEDSWLCDGCERPVFESMDTALAMGIPGARPVLLCPFCASGQTLQRIRAIPGARFPRRTVLEAVEHALTH